MLRNSEWWVQSLARPFRQVSTRGYAAKKQSSESKVQKSKTPAQEFAAETPINAHFLARTVGSIYKKWHTVLEKHPELMTLKRKDIVNSAELLKTLNYPIDDVLTKPMILYHNSLTLANRHSVLRECGFELITISIFSKYVTVMNKSVTQLKAHGYLPSELDLVERLRTCFNDVELRIPADCHCSDDMELKLLRQQILNCYLRQHLDMTDSSIEKMWKVYTRVRHKSFRSVQAMVQVLRDDLHFTNERITKNGYLLYGDETNVRRIISEIPTINGQDVREVVFRRPKILMSSCDTLLKTLEHVRAFGIGEEAVLRCLEVLTLGSDTVLERLRDLNEIEELQVLGTNPRVMRLIHYQNKARLRLEYLNQLKVRCASLHILSCDSDSFAKFARDGSDRTKGRDIVVYLAKIMEKQENGIRSMLARHPNWCHIPVIHVKQCYDFLLSKKFEVDDIYDNIHLLLYPIKRIEEKLQQLRSADFLEDLQLKCNPNELSNSEILTLILYLIECEFHFTGDGIWTEQQAHQVENFKNLLPDFPESLNKIYKYGMKPAANTNTAAAVAAKANIVN